MPYHLPLCENSEIMKSDNTLCLLLFLESQNLVWFLPKSLSDLGMNFENLSQNDYLGTL